MRSSIYAARRAAAGALAAALAFLPVASAQAPAASAPTASSAASPTPAAPSSSPAPSLATPDSDPDLHFDSDGLIVHLDDDGKINGGDTAQREGWYWLGVWLRNNTPGVPPFKPTRKLDTIDKVIALLEKDHDGVFYRHPKLPPWNNPYDKEWGTSRDQLVPLIAAMGVWGKNAELRRLWDAMPDDIAGKHAFNGDWRNFLGQAGPNCDAIRKRACNATASCPLQVDTRSCPVQVDTRNCQLQVDTRSCSQPHDERGCGCALSVAGHCVAHDPKCEGEKLGQNKIYDLARGSCESQKAAQNAGYGVAKQKCEAEKASQNAGYLVAKQSCEASKASQNAIYAADKTTCETGKTTEKYLCEADKQAEYQACRFTNVFSGDLLGPSSTNLFRRAMGQDPALPMPLDLSTSVIYTGPAGDGEMLVDSELRLVQAKDMDNVGNDLNHIVHLVMSELRYSSTLSHGAVATYLARPLSYGSYLDAYEAQFGLDWTNWRARMDNGIASGWKPSTSPIYGAVEWYHRPGIGANPELARLYEPIIATFFKKP